MVRPNIDQTRGIGDIQQLYRWNMSFDKGPAAITSVSADMNLRCESAEIPKLSIESIEANIRGHTVKHAGRSRYTNTITLNFLETVDSKVAQMMKDWRELVWASRIGTAVTKREYEAVVRLDLLNNQDDVRWRYTLYGAYYEDADPGGTLDGTTSDFLKPSIILSYDYFTDEAV